MSDGRGVPTRRKGGGGTSEVLSSALIRRRRRRAAGRGRRTWAAGRSNFGDKVKYTAVPGRAVSAALSLVGKRMALDP